MLKLVKHAGQTIYRIWFYVLVAIPILLFFPLLVIFASRETWRIHNFSGWPETYGLDLYCMVCFAFQKSNMRQRLVKGKSYMLVANHTSMLRYYVDVNR